MISGGEIIIMSQFLGNLKIMLVLQLSSFDLLSVCSCSSYGFGHVKVIRMICIDCVIVGLISIEF